MAKISKIIVFLDDDFFFSVKKVPKHPARDRKLELPGGRVDKGEMPLDALIRELAEEEQGGVLAGKVARLQLTPVDFKVGGDRHFIYHMPLAGDELQRVQMNSEEHYGYRLIPGSTIRDPGRMEDESVFTRRTIKIFAKLRRRQYFPYDRL